MKLRYLRTALGVLGIAGIVVFFLFPKEKKYECLDKEQNFYLSGDSASGTAFAELSNAGFICYLFKENGMCGAGFSFARGKNRNFKNWNLMDSLILYLQSSEYLKELIVQVLTIDPDHTNLESRSTMKPAIKELKLTPGKNRYSIYMEHLYTPDYWFEQQNVKSKGNMKRFSTVAGLELFSGWANKAGMPLELKIESICLEGHSNVPFVILICYLGILITIAISVRIRA
ncbi:MAG: hypothetical protein LBH25_03175 [Fibromonadaceae bacterium]|jgi:hypothetical protein|nr:hypothetical protein [Fibromonadaceae bacterium]